MIRALIPSFQVGGFEKFPNFHSWEYLGVHPPSWPVGSWNESGLPTTEKGASRFPARTASLPSLNQRGGNFHLSRPRLQHQPFWQLQLPMYPPPTIMGFFGVEKWPKLGGLKKTHQTHDFPEVAFHVSLAAKHPPQTHIGFRSKNINPARDD